MTDLDTAEMRRLIAGPRGLDDPEAHILCDALDAARAEITHLRACHDRAIGELHTARAELAESRAALNALGDIALDHEGRARQAEAALARAEALCGAEEQDDRESAALHRRGNVRCRDCDLRWDERQEYGCGEPGHGHRYNEAELAEALEPRDTDAEHASVPTHLVRAAVARGTP